MSFELDLNHEQELESEFEKKTVKEFHKKIKDNYIKACTKLGRDCDTCDDNGCVYSKRR